uniref:Hypothetical conserved protein n=1 Tax=uncultured Aquificia bacterium TaxID=453415 RepID=H5SAV5_9BACT|nr:hypothetical conserved protein [uncultured Aquificae bacterium]
MKSVYTEKAPKPVGPYSQAVICGSWLFLSGQVGIDPKTGLLKDSFEEQVRQIFENVEEILKTAGADKNSITKVVVYLKDLSLFATFSVLYQEFLKDVEVKPARTTVGVSELPLGAMVEIDIIAAVKQERG